MLDKLLDAAAAILFGAVVYQLVKPRPVDLIAIRLEGRRMATNVLDRQFMVGQIDRATYYQALAEIWGLWDE